MRGISLSSLGRLASQEGLLLHGVSYHHGFSLLSMATLANGHGILYLHHSVFKYTCTYTFQGIKWHVNEVFTATMMGHQTQCLI
jgi:hypothetical protein